MVGSTTVSWSTTLDNAGRITAKTESVGGTTTTYAYTYDALGHLETVTKNGVLDEDYAVDGNGRRTVDTVASRGISNRSFTYDAEDRMLTAGSASYTYDERDLLFQSVAAGVETTTFDYDAWGNLLLQTFHDATTAGHTYDVYGREASMTSRDGTVTTVVARNRRGLVEQERVDKGANLLAQTWTQYDSMGRVTTVKVNSDTLGTRFTYAPAGQLWKTQDPENRVATTAFDIMHRVASMKDGQGNRASYEYDANSNITTLHQIDYNEAASGPVTLPDITYGYDNLDRRISVKDIANKTTLSKYDSLGRLRWALDPNGNTARYTYDNLGRQIALARYESGGSTLIASTAQAFDLNGRLVGRTDPRNFTTAYHFDALDRRYKVSYADGSSETVLQFDDLRRPQQVRNQDGSLVTYGYDAEGRVTGRTTTAPNGILATTESFNYDGLGRVTSQGVTGTADSIATSTSFAYNDAANPPTVTKTIAVGSHTRTTTTSYLHTGQPVGTQLEGGRTLGYGYNGAGRLSGITMNGSPLADIDYVGGRRAQHTVGGEVKAAYGYTPSSSGYRVAGTTHTDVGTSAVLDARTNTWDGNYNRTGRSIVGGPAALQANHVYTYDGLNRMISSAKGAATLSYTLDPAGNRTQTSDGTTTEQYGFFGTGQRLHQYSATPQGDFGYDGAGRLNALLGPGNSYVYDAMGRLKELRLGAGAAVESMETSLPSGAVQDSGTWSVANGYLAETSAGAGRIRWPMAADLRKFTFLYWSGHDPADPDGDADTDPDHFDPEYYAQVILRATPYPAGPDEGHWKFLALVIQPDGIYLREWDKDAVTELGGAAVAIPKEQWHAVTIELSGANGETVTVKQALHNVSETQSIEATTTILDCEFVGFGVGEKANFRFDDVGTDKPVAGSIALRYHYDAYGRVVGRTLDPGGANVSQYFIYDNDRIVQELNGSGALVAEWVYGTYIDEVLAMFRDTDANGTLDATYYYLQDDLYNVIALTDANGNVVERYTYDDYGAPTVWIEDSQNPGTWIEHTSNGVPASSVGNPFLFTGRRWDEVLGLYDYRTRYYNPYLGRFLRIDTIGPWGDPSNLGNPYAYVGNNPWSRLDPWGEGAVLQWLFGMPEAQAWDEQWGINKDKLAVYESQAQRRRERAMATSDIAARHEHAVYGTDIFETIGPNGILPDYSNTYSAFLYAKDKGLEVGGQSIAIGTLMLPAGGVAILADAGYILVDSSDGTLDPLNTGLAVVGIGALSSGGRVVKRELEIQEAARGLIQVEARGSLDLVDKMSGYKGFAFDSFRQFKRYWGNAPEDYVWHHIVEQSQEGRFGGKAIHNVHNVVLVPRTVNDRINAFYSTKYEYVTGTPNLTVREWVNSTMSYNEAREFGLRVLQEVTKGSPIQ